MGLLGNLFHRHSSKSDLRGTTDWHSHILPGVDDGIQTIEQSIEILNAYADMGIESVWLTPHIMEDFPNTTASLRERFAQLADAWDGPVKLHLGAENMLDTLFESRLADNDLLPLEDNMLLVETSYYDAPANFDELLEEIVDKGYTPLLAHPERYNYMSPSTYDSLKARGILFQLNSLSLNGAYGPHVRDKAQHLLSAGAYEFSGTDIHSPRQLDAVRRLPILGRILR